MIVRPVAIPVPPEPQLDYQLSQQLAEEALELARVRQQLESLLQPLTSAHEVTIQATPLTLTISLDASVLFNSGKASLMPPRPGCSSVYRKVLRHCLSRSRFIWMAISDDQPIHTAQFPSNWSLSVERAVSVIEIFSQQRLDGTRLAAEGFSEYLPIANNATAAGRAKTGAWSS